MATLEAAIPHDVDNDLLRPWVEAELIDDMFATLSWKVFVALVWPVRADGEPCSSLTDRNGVPRFCTFRDARDLTPPHGLKPPPWSTARDERGVPLWNRHLSDLRFRRAAANTQADGRTLWDQDGAPVRYETRVNRVIFDYVRDQGLYNVEGQRSLTAPVYMSQGLYWDKRPEGGQVLERDPARQGSIAVKLAWKQLSTRDDPERYYTSPVPAIGPSGDPEPVDCALVGIHIAHKTQSCASWVWSTFEHVDALDGGDDLAGQIGAPLFRDPRSSQACNVDPAPDDHGVRRTQVERILPIALAAGAANQNFRDVLKTEGPKWAYFRLLGTQRMARIPRYRELEPKPKQLVNPLFETYVRSSGASAVDAHRAAHLADGSGSAADFMFLLRRAQPAWQQVAAIPADDGQTLALARMSQTLPDSLRAKVQAALSFAGAPKVECTYPGFEWLMTDGTRLCVTRLESDALSVYAPAQSFSPEAPSADGVR